MRFDTWKEKRLKVMEKLSLTANLGKLPPKDKNAIMNQF
jgi:hypothetical protein